MGKRKNQGKGNRSGKAQKPKTTTGKSTSQKQQAQTPKKTTTPAKQPQAQTPKKTTAPAKQPQAPTPKRATTPAKQPQAQTPKKTTTPAKQPQAQTPKRATTPVKKPQEQSIGQVNQQEPKSNGTEITIFERAKRHIRGHKDKVKDEIKYHPNYVFGETKTDYYSYGITESEKYDKRHKNIPLTKNPKKGDNRQMYIHKREKHDKKKKYTTKYSDYALSEADKKRIDDKIDAKYKK